MTSTHDAPRSHRMRVGRFSQPARVYHVTTTTYKRVPLFRDLALGRIIVSSLRRADEGGWVHSFAYVVMPDHVHWLFELGERRELSACVSTFKARSARAINQARVQTGSRVWQPGFFDHALRRDEDVRTVARYIVANPLRAGIVTNIGQYSLWDAAWL